MDQILDIVFFIILYHVYPVNFLSRQFWDVSYIESHRFLFTGIGIQLHISELNLKQLLSLVLVKPSLLSQQFCAFGRGSTWSILLFSTPQIYNNNNHNHHDHGNHDCCDKNSCSHLFLLIFVRLCWI